MEILRKLVASVDGSILPIFATVAPVLMMVCGLAIDYTVMHNQKKSLQELADASALAGAQELVLAKMSTHAIETVAENFVEQGTVNKADSFQAKIEWNAEVGSNGSEITTTIKQHWKPFFAQLFNSDITPIVVVATAATAGQNRSLCLLSLNSVIPNGIYLTDAAKIEAKNCNAYANSNSKNAISVDEKGKFIAKTICSSGGYAGIVSAFSPTPTTDCPNVPDPLASRNAPAVGFCKYNNKVISGGNVTLSAGTYCGGLTISGNAKVNFEKGVYVISDGKLLIRDDAEIVGNGVGFYLHGDQSVIEFTNSTTIELRAPVSGPMAGLLFFESRSAPLGRRHLFNARNAKVMVGTVYLPRGVFRMDTHSYFGTKSEFTVVIADIVELLIKPKLVLNADYDKTDIPVPSSAMGKTRLIR